MNQPIFENIINEEDTYDDSIENVFRFIKGVDLDFDEPDIAMVYNKKYDMETGPIYESILNIARDFMKCEWFKGNIKSEKKALMLLKDKPIMSNNAEYKYILEKISKTIEEYKSVERTLKHRLKQIYPITVCIYASLLKENYLYFRLIINENIQFDEFLSDLSSIYENSDLNSCIKTIQEFDEELKEKGENEDGKSAN